MLHRFAFWHIMNDYFEHAGVKCAGQKMIQIRREPSARQRVIMRHCNVIRRAGGVQLHNAMNKFLIHARLSAGEKQLESIEVIIEVINNRRKAVVGIIKHLNRLLACGKRAES